MKYYAHIYRLYMSWPLLLLRGVVVLLLCYLAYLSWEFKVLFPYLLFATQLFLMIELFMHAKIGTMQPEYTVSQESDDPLTSFTLQALISYQNGISGIMRILHTKAGDFLCQRFGLDKKAIPARAVDMSQLVMLAKELAQTVHGTYITQADLLCAYLLLVEPESQLLFTHHLKKEDILVMLAWLRMVHPEEEKVEPIRVKISGRGIGDAIVSGWTPETQKYTQEFSVNFYHRPHLFSREEQYQQILATLLKPENNNVLLVGEIGVGKENMLKAFAFDTSVGSLTEPLNYKRILELMIGPLIAGVANRADLETRLQSIIQEVSHAYNVLLYVPALENMLGNPSYQINIADALLPYLKSGKMPVIATMTTNAYKHYLEGSAVAQAFNVITVSEPDKQTALYILCEKVEDIERRTGVTLRYQALREAVRLSDYYAQDTLLPGSAVNLLEDAIRFVRQRASQTRHIGYLEEEDVTRTVASKVTAPILPPTQEEKLTLLSLEEQMQKRIIGQHAAVKAVAEAVRRIRSNIEPAKKPISFLFLGPTGVGKTETAKALADLYFGGEGQMLRFDMSEYRGQEGINRLIGSPSGMDDGRGRLTEAVHDHPSSLVLLDEFEKADKDVLNLLLTVLDDGRLTDARGKVISFRNTIVIATSNAGSEFIREHIKDHDSAGLLKQELLEYLQSQGIYTPELLNRFDDTVVFDPLTGDEQIAVTKLMLSGLAKYLEQQDIHMSYDDSLLAFIAEHGANNQFGARPLRRYIQDTIEDALAKMKLQDMLERGSSVKFSAANEEITYEITK